MSKLEIRLKQIDARMIEIERMEFAEPKGKEFDVLSQEYADLEDELERLLDHASFSH